MHIVRLVARLFRAGSEESTLETCRRQAQAQAGHRVVMPRDDITGLMRQCRKALADRADQRRLRQGALRTDVNVWDLAQLGRRSTALYRLPARQLTAPQHLEVTLP